MNGMLAYSDCDILGSGEEPVDQDTHEGRVQTKLHGQLGQFGIGHTLGNDYTTDSDTCSQRVREGVQT